MSRQLFAGPAILNPALLFIGGAGAAGGAIGAAAGALVGPAGGFVGGVAGAKGGEMLGEKILGKEDLGEGVARMKLKK
jgi:hypothetical protein